MKKLIFGALMLIAGTSFGQNLINNTSCSIYVRGRTSPGCSGTFGPICLSPGAAISVAGVEELTIHYRCSPACGTGLTVGIPGNCSGAQQQYTTPQPMGTCCSGNSMSIIYNTPSLGDWTVQ